MDRDRFTSTFGHWSGGALSQLTGVPGAPGRCRGWGRCPQLHQSRVTGKGYRVTLPCSFCFRRARFLVLLASPWGHFMGHRCPCTPVSVPQAEPMDPWESGGSFRQTGVIQVTTHRCPVLFEVPQSVWNAPSWPSGIAQGQENDSTYLAQQLRHPHTVLGAHIWTAVLSLGMSWRAWQAPADFTACKRSWNIRLPYRHWNSGVRINTI